MARYWVGGATGFLGSHLVKLLLARGHEVVGVSRSGGSIGSLELQAVDVLDPEQVRASASGCDGAFLATGLVTRDRDAAEELHRLHVVGTRHALQGLRAAGVRRTVVASTSGTIAVGKDPKRIFDERDDPPLEIISSWPYYRSKLFGESEAFEANSSDFEVVIVNPSLLLGPGDLRESSTGDVRRFLDRSIPAIPSGGMAFVDVRDAALGMWLGFERGQPGERYLLNAKNLTIAAFLQRLSRLTGVKPPLLRLPKHREFALQLNQVFNKAVRAVGGEPPIDEISVEMSQYFWYCDSAKAQEDLGWQPRDPGETLRDTVFDLVERGVVPDFRKRRAS